MSPWSQEEMLPARVPVRRLGEQDVAEASDVLTESFREYPVWRYVIGPESAKLVPTLRILTEFFVRARILRSEVLFGIDDGAHLAGVALVSRPGVSVSPPALLALRERTWSAVGGEVRARYDRFAVASSGFPIVAPHLHLNMIGVRPAGRGRGWGRALMDHVHQLSRDDTGSIGVSLNTEDPANVSLYEHFGYRRLGRVVIAPELTTWCMFRPD